MGRIVLVILLAIIPMLASSGHSRRGYCASCKRNAHGKIKRSQTARNKFKRSHPCPATGRSSGGCPGYVIDHVKPLKRGGADSPDNMQWMSEQSAKAKDKVE